MNSSNLKDTSADSQHSSSQNPSLQNDNLQQNDLQNRAKNTPLTPSQIVQKLRSSNTKTTSTPKPNMTKSTPKSRTKSSTKSTPKTAPKSKPSTKSTTTFHLKPIKAKTNANTATNATKIPAKSTQKSIKDFAPKMRMLKKGLEILPSFEFAGVKAGVKYKDRLDMALLYSATPCVAAGVFTRNKVRAACVEYNIERLKDTPYFHSVIINAGNANACTGERGKKDCLESALSASIALDIDFHSTLLASTGVIGVPLPMPKIKKGILSLAKAKGSSEACASNAAKAIMTTDTHQKQCALEFRSKNGLKIRLAGIAKGSGMIHPNMATLLGFVITDINISQKLLQKALKKVTKNTFNMISVDRDTSTNDMVLALSNKTAKNELIVDERSVDYKSFVQGLMMICDELSRQIAKDGEGASKLITASVQNAPSKRVARKLAKSIISSNLVKCAVYGNDANWGRILCAMGYAGVEFPKEKLDLKITSKGGEIIIMKNGQALQINEKKATRILGFDEVSIIADLKNTNSAKSAKAYGCDLTPQYISINADYRS